MTDQAPQGALPTPRTDAEERRLCSYCDQYEANWGQFVDADFARALERELAAQARQIEELKRDIAIQKVFEASYHKQLGDYAECRAKLAAAQQALGEAEKKAKLYEIVRCLNVPQFKELYMRNIKGHAPFDKLVEAIGALTQEGSKG